MTPTVLVLGATGRFGGAAVRAFAAAGWQVIAQRRPRPGVPAALPGVRWLDVPAEFAATQAGAADVVVHAMNPAYTAAAWRAEAPRQMATSVDAAAKLGALLMFPGNVYNFGARMPAVLREDTPQRPTTTKGEVRVAIERQLRDACSARGVRSIVVRAGDFFGSGAGTLLDLVLAKSLGRGRITLPGALNVATPYAYLPDLAQAFVRLAQRREQVTGAETFHFAGHAVRGQDWVKVLERFARDAGFLAPAARARVGRLPWPVIRAGGLLLPQWASMAEMRYLWTTPHTLDNSQLVARLGAEPRTAFEVAVREALVELRLLPVSAAAALAA